MNHTINGNNRTCLKCTYELIITLMVDKGGNIHLYIITIFLNISGGNITIIRIWELNNFGRHFVMANQYFRFNLG